MKITEIETILLRPRSGIKLEADGTQDALIVRVHTDEGITGVGQAHTSPYMVQTAIQMPSSQKLSRSLRDIVMGQNPFDVERIWEEMYRYSIFHGRRGAVVHAISGIDIALWDIIGKAKGQPIYQLLGGGWRDRVRAYASTLMPETPEAAAEECRRCLELGFTAVKLGWGLLGQDPKRDLKLTEACRKALGDGPDLILDIGGFYDAATVIPLARELERLGVYLLEEPINPDDYAGYRRLADAVDLRIACGEKEATRWDFQRLLDEAGVDVIQPDVARCGGLTEMKKIAFLAGLKGRAVTAQEPVGAAAAAGGRLGGGAPGARTGGGTERGDAASVPAGHRLKGEQVRER